MKRKGKALKEVPAGDRRRMSDAKNAWRKMTHAQRVEFLEWLGQSCPMHRHLCQDEYCEERARVTGDWT